MEQREQLKEEIERERKKLNQMLAREAGAEEVYRQSLFVDRLIEQYLSLET